MNRNLDGWHYRDRPEPALEQVLLPERHEFRVAAPEGGIVHGYVLSYEIWDEFVRVNTVLVGFQSGAIHDRPALQLADGSFARLIQGSGGGGERLSSWSAAFARPAPGRVTLGLGGGHLGKPERGVRFTPITDLRIP
ncbi:hypothetical protein [Sinomonas terrae]|uniref:Uncharacterized protein n=1 Tax=Sinomonas terrae TaxID=2908838 RepID=A0ABS9TZK0_9MICC|nr:hypothetical protein [Sinomonas terrae]MCH6469866.1 hypothetical protein [Sinomonas terrae]